MAGFELKALNLSLLMFSPWEVTASDDRRPAGIVLGMSISNMGFLKTSALVQNASMVNWGTVKKASLGYHGCSFHYGSDVADGVGLFVECYCYCPYSYYCSLLLEL